jgi:hypothetical protein
MNIPILQRRCPTGHCIRFVALAAIALLGSSANAITRSEAFTCLASNGGKFVLKSTYDYNPLNALNPHGGSERNHADFTVTYHPPGSFSSIATSEFVRYAYSRYRGSPDGPGTTIRIRSALCLGGKVVAGIPQFGSTLIVAGQAVRVNPPSVPTLLMDAAIAAHELDQYSAGGRHSGLTAYKLVNKQLVHEIALEDSVAVCKEKIRNCLIRAVYRTISQDMGKTWSPWKFATESDVFNLGKAWDQQPILTLQDRSDGIPNEAYDGLSPQTKIPRVNDPIAAAWRGSDSLQAVRGVLKNTAAVDLQNGGGMTSLMYAALAGNLEFTKELVKLHANVNAFDNVSDPVLTYAARSGNVELLNWLLKQGARPLGDGPLKGTVLTGLLAHWEGDWQQPAVDRLLVIPEVLNQADASGTTPLMYASGHGLSTVVQAMLAKGADASVVNKRGANALHFAAMHGSAAILAQLLHTRVNLDALDARGKTALHYAVLSQSRCVSHRQIQPALAWVRLSKLAWCVTTVMCHCDAHAHPATQLLSYSAVNRRHQVHHIRDGRQTAESKQDAAARRLPSSASWVLIHGS